MLKEAPELARYYSVADAARCTGLPEARIRDWQLKKAIAPALTKGRIQFSRADVVRMHVLAHLQELFGQTLIATRLAQALSPEQLDAVLDADRPEAKSVVNGRTYVVQLDPLAVAALRARMAEVPT